MKFLYASAALAFLAAQVSAVPTGSTYCPYWIQATFTGGPASYTWWFPTTGSESQIYDQLSVSQITVPAGVTCVFTGVNGSRTTVVGPSTQDVGPPQTQVSGNCRCT